ncbi:MAG: Mrp/NBP35 family ATP-binding protein [Planctomycetota bacterium]
MAATKDQVVDVLRGVQDPELKRDIVTLNMVQHVEIESADRRALVEVKLPARARQFKERFRAEASAGIEALGLTPDVRFSFELTESAPSKPQQAPDSGAEASGGPLPGVKHIVAVGAGKGGVGKSTVAVNLAVGLARTGSKVGLMDGDIYGPSLPTMLGTDRFEPRTVGKMIVPFEVHGVKSMTIGALVEDDKPLIWRGPMAHGAFQQLATQTDWGELDYLIIDLPPGTGDVPLTMSQILPLTGAVVVCTPQKVAQDDARRAISMFRQLRIEVLGLVENMSYFIGDDGKEYDLFGRGGAEMLARSAGVPFLGAVPINTNLRRNADAGDPTANFTGDDTLAAELEAVTRALVRQVGVHVMSGAAAGPTLTVS